MEKLKNSMVLFAGIFLVFLTVSVYAVPPKVIKTIPENRNQNVDPGLRQIRIEFDQDMSHGRYSICGGGPKYPKTIGKPKWINKKTIEMRVKLQPNHEYELSVNCQSYKNFKNLQGESAVIYPIKFKTTTAGEKSTTSTKSPSLLLQEGLYAEETEGDLDKAIEIYQRVIDEASEIQRLAAKATYQLGMCYLKKGDKTKAAEYFQEAVNYYPEQKTVVKKAQQQLEKIAPTQELTLGSLVPVVIDTTPETYANNVEPEIGKISVTFDRTMADGSWSWVKWNYPYPETAGLPYYDATKTTCTLPVKLEAGKAYFIRINAKPYTSFRSADGVSAQPYVLVFATKDENGNATPIPKDMLAKAKEINAIKPARFYTQQLYAKISPEGILNFKTSVTMKNDSSSAVNTTSFINSDFVNVTAMHDDKGRPIEFTSTHTGNIYRYNVTFNEPILPGQTIVYSHEGTMTGLIKPVPNAENTFWYHMVHSPSAGQPTLRVETFLLPEGAELISTRPADMKRTDKNGRIELHLEKIIPAGGNIVTQFQYKLLKKEKAKSPIDLSTPEATIKSFVKAVYDGNLEAAKACVSKDGHDYDEFKEMLATESNHPFQAMIKAMDASIPVEITSKDITTDRCKIKWYFTLGRVYYIDDTKIKKGTHQKFGSYLELVSDKWLIRDI